MNIIELIQGGDLAAKQHRLSTIGYAIVTIIKENRTCGVHMERNEKLVVLPLIKALGIPHRDAGPNGVLIGTDQDKVDRVYESI